MAYPLLLRAILERTRTLFPRQEIVSRTANGTVRETYADMYRRVCRLANALERLGVGRGDRVGTFAWNHHQHLELCFAAPCMGAVLHTVNIRLFPEQQAYICNHAEDKVLFIDPDLVPAIEAIRDQLHTVRHYVVLCDRASLPETSLNPVHAYEELLAEASDSYSFPEDLLAEASDSYSFPEDLDEDSPASMCYTSATTGNPKGMVFSHRTLYLHTTMLCMTDSLGICERDTILPVVPMFHANTWGLPWAAGFVGARQVLLGPRPDTRTMVQFIQSEQVTLASGVPTIWIGVLELLEKERYDLSSIRAILTAEPAVPQSLIEAYDKKGVPILHAYGMTEAAPLTHVGRLKSNADALSEEERYRLRAKQGILAPGLEMRLVDEEAKELPWDGKQMGEVLLRGPWVGTEYYNDTRTKETYIDGWYHAGDVATVDPEGYLEIADRTKDLVKSGGEWISSLDLENHLMAHPAVREAAVVAVPHNRWQERPVACVVLKQDQAGKIAEAELLGFLEGKVAKWWLPDRVVFIDEVPKTGVGKFDKKVLRAQFQDLLVSDT